MGKKSKGTTIRGDSQKLLVRCRNCGHSKKIEVRKNNRHRRIYGAVLLTSDVKPD